MRQLTGGNTVIVVNGGGKGKCAYCGPPEEADEAIWKVTYDRECRKKEQLACDVHMESALHDAEQEASPITSIVIVRIAD